MTMIPWEFFAFNATTALLWLFQTCNHEILLILITLGVLCIIIALVKIAISVVSLIISSASYVLASLGQGLLILLLPPFILESSLDPEHVALDRDTASSVSESAALPLHESSLTLPQSLALNPYQWPLRPSPPLPTELPQIATSSSSAIRPPYERPATRLSTRRSRRSPRPRLATSP